jgi:glutaredoxin
MPPGQVEALLRTVPITLYTTPGCPHCSRARQWLRHNGIPFEERDIERNPADRRAMTALNPRGSVPTIEVDGQVLVGFNERQVGAAIKRSVQRRLRKP